MMVLMTLENGGNLVILRAAAFLYVTEVRSVLRQCITGDTVALLHRNDPQACLHLPDSWG